MESSRDDPGGSRLAAVATALLAFCLVLSVATPVVAQGQSSTTDSYSPGLLQQEGDALSCLDGISKQKIAQELNSRTIQQVNTKLNQNSEQIPNSVRSAMVGERVNIKVESTYFSMVINRNARVEQIETSRLENPTVRATTDCETFEDIIESDNRQATLQRKINQDAIQWEGLTATSEAETSYGEKGVQTYTIATNEETGDTDDAAKGFSNGLKLD